MPAPQKKKNKPGIPAIKYQDCWAKTTVDGKPGISVYDHCLNVGLVSEALLASLPDRLRCLLSSGVVTLAALHDMGKVCLGFQAKCLFWLDSHHIPAHAACGCETDHARVSQHTLQEMLSPGKSNDWAVAVGAHHGKIKGGHTAPISIIRDPHASWGEERKRLTTELIASFGEPPGGNPDLAILCFVAGLITVADWIGSDERWFQSTVADMTSDERRSLVHHALERIGWGKVDVHQSLQFNNLFPPYTTATELQVATRKLIQKPGLYLIEGPMGCGKTEAALEAAYSLLAINHARGIYFALPTQLTSNRIHCRVDAFLKNAVSNRVELRLAHSSSWLVDKALPLQLRAAFSDNESRDHTCAGRSWFTSSKRALLAPFGVGTIDQALLGVVAAKHFFVRQFGLAGKVVILDEVHSYDLYTSTLIDTLIKRLLELQCTVIILSATLTDSRRRELLGIADREPLSNAYPLLLGKTADGRVVQVPIVPSLPKTVSIKFPAELSLIEAAIERARHGECLLWIHNTIDDAQATYRKLMGANCDGGPEVALLHSRFPFYRREQIESDWIDRLGKDSSRRPRNGCILVSTQIAEQSVDIDADLLITDLAPSDMLLQRLGRLWRHNRPERRGAPESWIIAPSLSSKEMRTRSAGEIKALFGKSSTVYAPYILLRSWAEWHDRAQVVLPIDIRVILEATYATMADEPHAWQQLRKEVEAKKQTLADCALSATNFWTNPALDDDEGVQTRYNNYPTIQMLLVLDISSDKKEAVKLKLLDGESITVKPSAWDFDVAKAIYRNLVRIPQWVVNIGQTGHFKWLENYVASMPIVGLVQKSGGIEWPDANNSNANILSYNEKEGIVIIKALSQKKQEIEYEYFD